MRCWWNEWSGGQDTNQRREHDKYKNTDENDVSSGSVGNGDIPKNHSLAGI
jgi:hypothetical protein